MRYLTRIFWSKTDQVFIAEMPELKGCIVHGDSQAEALREVNKVAKEWLLIAKEKGWNIPQPKGRLLFA